MKNQIFTELINAIFTQPWDKHCTDLLRQAQEAYPYIRFISLNNHQNVYSVGMSASSIYLLVKGTCHIMGTSHDGKLSVLYINNAPVLYGMTEALTNRPFYSATITAASNCLLISIPTHAFLKLISNDSKVLMHRLYSTTLVMDNNLLANLRRSELSKKMQLALYFYEKSLCQQLPAVFSITRNKLSELLNINLRTLYRYINLLVEDDMLTLQNGKLYITEANQKNLRKLLDKIYYIN